MPGNITGISALINISRLANFDNNHALSTVSTTDKTSTKSATSSLITSDTSRITTSTTEIPIEQVLNARSAAALLEVLGTNGLPAPSFLALLLSLISTTFLVTTMTRSKCFKGYTHYLVGNMALAQFLHTWSQVFLWSVEDYSTSLWTCLSVYTFSHITYLASQLSMLVVTLDRYMGVVHPAHYQSVADDRPTVIFLCLVWIVAVPIGFLPQLGWRVSPHSYLMDEPDTRCLLHEVHDPTYLRTYYIISFFMPLIFFIVLYFRIYLEIHRRMREVRDQKEWPFYPVPFAKEHKLAKTMALAGFISLFLSLPFHCLLMAFTYPYPHPDLVSVFSLILPAYLLHPAFPILIYYKRSRQFRKAFCKALCCCTCE